MGLEVAQRRILIGDPVAWRTGSGLRRVVRRTSYASVTRFCSPLSFRSGSSRSPLATPSRTTAGSSAASAAWILNLLWPGQRGPSDYIDCEVASRIPLADYTETEYMGVAGPAEMFYTCICRRCFSTGAPRAQDIDSESSDSSSTSSDNEESCGERLVLKV